MADPWYLKFFILQEPTFEEFLKLTKGVENKLWGRTVIAELEHEGWIVRAGKSYPKRWRITHRGQERWKRFFVEKNDD